MQQANQYKVVGVMSGTSLDGLDIACCQFHENNGRWTFNIAAADTISYSEEWKKRLQEIENGTALELAFAHVEYGKLIGESVRQFLKNKNFAADFIASHGHTVFHQPDKKLTLQIGSGAAIAAAAGLPVVCDFRSVDVALGGQGAPLVPVGDKILFKDYACCLNLGGFANVSFDVNNIRTAFDVCPANIVLNALAEKEGKDYDDKGTLARAGKLNAELLNELNSIDFYTQKPPKSLGKEWVMQEIDPLLNKYDITVADKLRTVTEHAAVQISEAVKGAGGKVLATGGGAFNDFLMERLAALSPNKIVIPVKEIINFKEALIFAFLGALRIRGEVNCLKTVTGAERDNAGGAVYIV